MSDMNPLEVLIVQGEMDRLGIRDFTLQQGNNCIWARYWAGGQTMNEYFIFRDGRLVEVQMD